MPQSCLTVKSTEDPLAPHLTPVNKRFSAYVDWEMHFTGQGLLVSNPHLVHIEAISAGDIVAVELDCIRELVVPGIGKERIMADIHGGADAVHCEGVVKDGMRSRIVVVFGHHVVPGSGREALEAEP